MSRRRLAALLVALTALIANCSAGSAESASSGNATVDASAQAAEDATAIATIPDEILPAPNLAEPGENETPTVEPEAPSEEGGGGAVLASPIEQLLGAEADPKELSALYSAAEIEVAEIATVCIRREGYDYVALPQPAPPPESFIPSGKTNSDLVAEFGYAVWIVDNAVQSLSESRTLVPIESRVTQAMLDDGVFLPLRARCRGEARSQVSFFQNQSVPDRVAGMVGEFRRGLDGHPDVVAKWTEWSRCMLGQGYEYPDRQSIGESLSPEVGQLLAQILQLQPGPNFAVPAELESEIEVIRDLELMIVNADLDCAFEVELDQFLEDFTVAAELAFVDEFGDQILLELAAARSAN